MTIGASEAETFWTEFLRSLTRRGLQLGPQGSQGRRDPDPRRDLAKMPRALHAQPSGPCRQAGSTLLVSAFAQEDARSASARWRQVADQLRPKAAGHDVLAYMSFPKEQRTRLHSVNPLERLNGEIKRQTNVVGNRVKREALAPLHNDADETSNPDVITLLPDAGPANRDTTFGQNWCGSSPAA